MMLQMESERKEKMNMKNNNNNIKMMKKKKKKTEKGKEIERQRNFSERSPLQELKRFPRNGSINTSIPSSSTSVSVEEPRGCLRFLLSSNSKNSCSCSCSGSRKHQCRRKIESLPKPSSGTPCSAPNLTRLRSKPSKENDLPRVVTSRKCKKNPSFLSQWQSGKNSRLKATRASGSVGFEANRKDLKQENTCCSASSGQQTELFSFKVSDNLNSIDNCTPVGKSSCWSALDSSVFDDKQPVFGDSNSTSTTTKTPPVEASVSPEIQSGVSNLFGSAATPVCYGVSHLLSGVTDKRKCRPRGILTIGIGDVDESLSSACEETSVCADDYGNGSIATEILAKSRPSFIPLPTEASMKWLPSSSSPQGESHQKSDSSDHCVTLLSSSSFSLPFSPSNCLPSDIVSVSDSEDIYDSISNFDPTTTTSTTSTGKTRIVLLSPIRTPNSHGFSGFSPETVDAHFLSATPLSNSSHDISCLQKDDIGDYCRLDERSPSSTGFFSSGNVVQTPTSDSSSGRFVNIVQTDLDEDKQAHELFDDDLEIDSMAEFLDRTSLSPRIHTTKWDPSGLSSCASWVSDSTLHNLSLSQMRISWREGLGSQMLDADDFDYCICLSDEEKEGDDDDDDDIRYPDNELSSPKKPFDESITTRSKQQKISSKNDDGPNSPEFLDQEPKISGKDKLSPARHSNAFGAAESMSIDAGGGLVVSSSGDSDWNEEDIC